MRTRTVVVASTFTAEPLGDAVEFWKATLGLPLELRFAGYDQVFQELLDPASEMARNADGLDVVALRLEDWGLGDEGRQESLDARIDEFAEAVRSAAGRLRVPLLVVVCPLSRVAQRDDATHAASLRAEKRVAHAIEPLAGVHLVTSADLLARYELEVYDDAAAGHGEVPYLPELYAALGTEIVRTLRATEVPPAKVLVLDGDETLWSGVVGEEGPDGVVVDAPRRALQEFALEQRRAGVLLCLSSKNAEEDVLAVLDHHPDMLLRREHFASLRIDWNEKSESLRSLASELGVGLDSFVFVDDNARECAEVVARCPGVTALALPDSPSEIPSFLAGCWAFDRLGATAEDARRAEYYEAAAERDTLRASSATFEDFIASLELVVRISPVAPGQVPRLSQLTQRTNQFNNTTIRRTEAQVAQELASGEMEGLVVEVSDRFGDYGLVGVALYTLRAGSLWVESLLMSCRTLGRGVEHQLLARLGEIAVGRGLASVDVPFERTVRNAPMLRFLEEVGSAGGGSGATDETVVFRLEAADAAAMTYDPARAVGEAPENSDVTDARSESAPSSPFRLDSTQLAEIAAHARSAQQILSAIDASVVRRGRDTDTTYTAPSTPLEETLAGMWADALHVDRVGVDDDFFELGGTSLAATMLVNRIQRTLGRRLESIVVFDEPTVAGVAALLEGTPADAPASGPVIPVRSGERRGPLSSAQERLWFLDQFNPGSTVYNERRAVRLRGPLRVDALEAALADLVERHESLRTTFPAVDGRPEQVVGEPESSPLAVTDLSKSPEAEREAHAVRLVSEEASRPFDLGAGPLFRAGLVRIEDGDHLLWLVFHHIVADGSSVGILFRELAALYRERVASERAGPLPETGAQYLDYAAWQRERPRDERTDDHRAYWRERLSGVPALELPADHPRPPILTYRGSAVPVAVSGALVEKLRAVGRGRRATLFMTLMAAFDAVLARHSGQDEVVVGFPVANRREPELDGVVGFFVNTLPLRVDLSGNPTFEELLDRVRTAALAAYARQDVPFEDLVDDAAPERDLARTPIFQVMLALLDDPAVELDLPGLAVTTVVVPVDTTRFDLVLNLEESESGLRGSLEYSSDLFERETVERLVGHLLTLLEGIVDDPSERILEVPLLTEAERAQALDEWAGGSAEFAPATLHGRFAEQVARTPDAPAVVFEDTTLSYRELNERANRLAHRLQRVGVAPGDLVGLCVDRSLELVVGILGILKAGGAYLPLDPAYPPDRLRFLLEDSASRIVVGGAEQLASVELDEIETVQLDGESGLEQEPTGDPDSRARPSDLAYVIYTSGSTGQPKGVPISHANVSRLLDATDRWYGFDASDVWTLFHSFAFDFSVWELWGALLYGGRLVVVPYWVSRSPEAFHELLLKEGVTVLNQTPSAFRQLIQADQASDADPSALALRYVIFGGEALELQSLRPWFERHGDARPELVNMYGITETTVHVTYRPITLADVEAGAGSMLGRPIPDLQLYLLNSALQPVPVGVAGEICVGGAGVARGYLNRPELTAERFVANPFTGHDGELLYRSGDLARRLPNGDVEYLGRIDHQVKIRGFRIELGEIESAIAANPLVRETVVLAREDTPGDRRLVAYVATAGQGQGIMQELKDALAARLPEYMVPHHFVILDALPLTANGKIDRKALPAPELWRTGSSTPYVAPETPVEQTIAGVWSSVLGVERIGVDDNFFELGGDSILSIQVVARCRAAGVKITPRDLFRSPTIAGLSRVAEVAVPSSSEEEGVPEGAVSLTPIQHWFFEQRLANRNHWNQSFVFEVPADIDVDRLEDALHQVVSHHDALRLRFREADGGWQQEYGAAPSSTPIVRVDLSSLSQDARADAVVKRGSALQERLDISAGPLLRAAHFDFGSDQPGRLLVAIHHLAVDGVSWRILVEDLESAYASLGERRAVQLAPRTTSFKRWSEALEAHASSPEVRASLGRWQDVADSDAVALPTDRERGASTEESARTVSVSLDPAETRDLLQRVPAVYGTEINDALIAALGQALAEWTGRSSFVVELEGHGREDLFEGVDLSRTVGWFTTIFPVRIPGATDPRAALVGTKEALRQVPDRGLSYGLLRYLGDDEARRGLADEPEPDLIFNYLGQLDQVVSGSGLFRFAGESSGPWHDPQSPRRHALELMTFVRDGRLEAQFVFSDALHEQDTIARLADSFVEALRAIVAHCTAAASSRKTPSDFPLVALDEAALDRLLEAHPSLEDVYPLSPMQRLFHAMDAMTSGVGLEEWRFELRGPLRADELRRAWETLVARHPVLRTAFAVGSDGEPLQVVERAVELPWREVDLRGEPPAVQEQRIRSLLDEERTRGFDLAQAPLLRLVLVRRDEELHELLWLTHHLYVDGWSWPVLFDELRALYGTGGGSALPEVFPYGRYIAWLAGRTGDSEAFWKSELAGVDGATPLTLEPAGNGGPATAEETLSLTSAETEELRTLARRSHLTTNSVVQAAWASLLAHYSGEPDVVFGAAFSGRPAELPGIDHLVGPCVNNVPVRAHVSPADTFVALATQLQERQADITLHQYDSLGDIQVWAELPAHRRLFDSLVVFQNYAVDDAPSLGDDVEVELLLGPDATNYPVTLVVVPAAELRLKVLVHGDRMPPRQASTMARDLRAVLAFVAGEADPTVADVLARLPAETRGKAAEVAARRGEPASAPFVAPVGQMEEAVAAIWRDLFQVERIGMDDNFFDLGGHSLLLLRAHGRIRDEVRPDVPIAVLFQYPTVRSLARFLSGADGGGGSRTRERAEKQKEALARMRLARSRR